MDFVLGAFVGFVIGALVSGIVVLTYLIRSNNE